MTKGLPARGQGEGPVCGPRCSADGLQLLGMGFVADLDIHWQLVDEQAGERALHPVVTAADQQQIEKKYLRKRKSVQRKKTYKKAKVEAPAP